MPTVFEALGYRFFFYSNENDEPIHIHVEKGDGKAKYWLLPTVTEEYSYGFKVKERKEIKNLVIQNTDQIVQHWNRFFA